MFKTIETDWIYNPYTPYIQRHRFIGPMWMAWLVVKTEGRHIPKWIGRLFSMLSRLTGARIEIQTL